VDPLNPDWEDYYDRYGSFLPIFFALFTAIVGTIRMTLIKFFVKSLGYDAMEYTFTTLLIQGTYLFIISIIVQTEQYFLIGEFFALLFASIFACTALVLIQ
jgi:hypothetical protein